MRETFLATVSEALDADPRLALVLADISAGSLTEEMRRHPDRVINVGIREQALIGVAAGLALAGMRPVVHTFAPFLVERPFEQLKLDLVHQDVGAVLVSYGASYDMPTAGRTHQAPGDVAVLDSLPGWTIRVPGHPAEVRTELEAAFARDDRTYVRLSAQVNATPHRGAGFQVVQWGSRGVVLAVGPMLDRVLAATAGQDVTVAYVTTVRPFDGAALRAAVERTGSTDVVLVEPYLAGTSAHVVSDALTQVPHRLRSLGVGRDAELRMYGTMADHDRAHGLDEAGLAVSIKEFLG